MSKNKEISEYIAGRAVIEGKLHVFVSSVRVGHYLNAWNRLLTNSYGGTLSTAQGARQGIHINS
jgi:hypothetical protein